MVKQDDKVEAFEVNNMAYRIVFILGLILFLALSSLGIRYIAKEAAYQKEGLKENYPMVDINQWKEFRSDLGNFNVLLPVLPQHASQMVSLPNSPNKLKYDLFLAQEKDGTNFMINVISYPDDMDLSNPQSLLENVMNEMVAGDSNNQLKYSEKGKFQHSPSLEFAIENPQFLIQSRAFLVEKMLYVLTVVDRIENYNQNEYRAFINSFHFIPHLSEMNIPQGDNL